MNAWLPQASYPCGNFSDTSSVNIRQTRGSLGHAFTAYIHTENISQISICPYTLREISVLSELILGHLCYYLTDVPPQPNSPPDSVISEDLRRLNLESRLWNRILTNQLSKTTLEVVVSHRRLSTPTYICTSQVISQCQTRVKLNRVFFPRRYAQARSLGCGFAR